MLPVQGNAKNILAVSFGTDKTWSATATITTAEQTATIKGLKTTDYIMGVSKPTAQAGLGVVGWRVSAADTIAITFDNPTAGNLTSTALENWTAFVFRPETILTDLSV